MNGNHFHSHDLKDCHWVRHVNLNQLGGFDVESGERPRPQQKQTHATIEMRAPDDCRVYLFISFGFCIIVRNVVIA